MSQLAWFAVDAQSRQLRTQQTVGDWVDGCELGRCRIGACLSDGLREQLKGVAFSEHMVFRCEC